MKNEQITDEGIFTEFPVVTEEIMGFLDSIRKWSKFLSILGFIGCGFLILAAIFMGVFMGSLGEIPGGMSFLPAAMISVIYIILTVLYFFPVYYLFRFSVSMGNALNSADKGEFHNAFLNLSRHYKFIGIMTIVIISIYILAMLGGITAAAIFGGY